MSLFRGAPRNVNSQLPLAFEFHPVFPQGPRGFQCDRNQNVGLSSLAVLNGIRLWYHLKSSSLSPQLGLCKGCFSFPAGAQCRALQGLFSVIVSSHYCAQNGRQTRERSTGCSFPRVQSLGKNREPHILWLQFRDDWGRGKKMPKSPRS